MPSMEEEPAKSGTRYSSVLSKDNRNYQMFAFCPSINQKKCGIENSDSSDMVLTAGIKKKLVYSK